MTKKKNRGGRPTKYSKELGEKIAEEMTHSTIEETCKKFNISRDSYYKWIYRHKEFADISTEARKTKAVKHFTECESILEEIKDKSYDEDIRSDLLRLRLDFHLRLAGKANQGLFGDKANIDVTTKDEPVNVSFNFSKE
jgi:transposase-like protein